MGIRQNRQSPTFFMHVKSDNIYFQEYCVSFPIWQLKHLLQFLWTPCATLNQNEVCTWYGGIFNTSGVRLEDGTEVEDDDYLESVPAHTLLGRYLYGEPFLTFFLLFFIK